MRIRKRMSLYRFANDTFQSREEILSLIDLALKSNDKEWFMELTNKLNEFDEKHKEETTKHQDIKEYLKNNHQLEKNKEKDSIFQIKDEHGNILYDDDLIEQGEKLQKEAERTIIFLRALILEYKSVWGDDDQWGNEKIKEVENMIEQLEEFFDI